MKILDVCCGGRMMWQDRENPNVVFADIRNESITLPDKSRGNNSGERTITISPETQSDFTNLPFADDSFHLVVFDPPHLKRAGPKSWLGAKYGKLGKNWQDEIKKGFEECFRVLKPNGTLVFKWNEAHIKIGEVVPLSPHKPLFGHLSGRTGLTHWLVFGKYEQGE